jgi:hypothetical protein
MPKALIAHMINAKLLHSISSQNDQVDRGNTLQVNLSI